jgi:hypothetical protein
VGDGWAVGGTTVDVSGVDPALLESLAGQTVTALVDGEHVTRLTG